MKTCTVLASPTNDGEADSDTAEDSEVDRASDDSFSMFDEKAVLDEESGLAMKRYVSSGKFSRQDSISDEITPTVLDYCLNATTLAMTRPGLPSGW